MTPSSYPGGWKTRAKEPLILSVQRMLQTGGCSRSARCEGFDSAIFKLFQASGKTLERRILEQRSIVETFTALVSSSKTKVSSIEGENILLQRMDERLVRRYGKRCIVLGPRIGKLTKCVATRFSETSMCISTAILK